MLQSGNSSWMRISPAERAPKAGRGIETPKGVIASRKHPSSDRRTNPPLDCLCLGGANKDKKHELLTAIYSDSGWADERFADGNIVDRVAHDGGGVMEGSLQHGGSDRDQQALHTVCGQKITLFTACLINPGPKLRLDCRYQNITNNQLRYEFRVKREREPQVILSTMNLNFFSDKYHNRASTVLNRGLVQLHLERFNASDVGLYTCQLNIPNDLTINQTSTINVQKGKLERCGGVSTLNLSTSWPLVLLLTLPLLQAGGFLCL
ncbi:thy-1 membrane glycoprotein [Pelodytes ibericus]